MKSTLELELELSNAKLEKMTSTVKQLGTKLKEANKELAWAKMEADHFRSIHRTLENKISYLVLSVDECHERASKTNYPRF